MLKQALKPTLPLPVLVSGQPVTPTALPPEPPTNPGKAVNISWVLPTVYSVPEAAFTPPVGAMLPVTTSNVQLASVRVGHGDAVAVRVAVDVGDNAGAVPLLVAVHVPVGVRVPVVCALARGGASISSSNGKRALHPRNNRRCAAAITAGWHRGLQVTGMRSAEGTRLAKGLHAWWCGAPQIQRAFRNLQLPSQRRGKVTCGRVLVEGYGG